MPPRKWHVKRVTALRPRPAPSSAIPKRGLAGTVEGWDTFLFPPQPATLRFTCVALCVSRATAATTVVSDHNSKSLRCANRVCQRSRWNVKPRASTIIKPCPRSQSPHVRRDMHTRLLSCGTQDHTGPHANLWHKRRRIVPLEICHRGYKFVNRNKFVVVK